MTILTGRAQGNGSAPPANSAVLDLVFEEQARRVEMIERVAPSVVCIYDADRRGGGSGVLIDPQGDGLTNFHVVHPLMKTRRGWGGLSDGALYELEVLGIDPTGDVAMFRLIGPDAFPHATLGDSDAVEVGDQVFALGNPFTLSEDYTPSVTMGIVTGTHRYQRGVKGNLIYSDCIQVDAAINPGNSGGPLFNQDGEVIGINGRISINRRGRFNVGFGYAITSNQIKRFLPALKAGLLARHGTLQAIVEDRDEQGVVFSELIRRASAYAAGVRVGDRLLAFDGVPLTSANHFASLLGTYPEGWEVPLVIERGGARQRLTAKLEPIQPKMRAPFEPDPEVNMRQVGRVLKSHQAAVMKSPSCLPREWHWTVERQYLDGAGSVTETVETFDVSRWSDRTVYMVKRTDDGRQGRIIEVDGDHAIQRNRIGGRRTELAAPERLALRAVHVLQGALLNPIENLDPTRVRHAGGVSPTPGLSDRRAPDALPLEVVEWQWTDGVAARFAFDPRTYWVVQATLVDVPSGAEVTIAMSDHRDVGGIVLPCRMRMSGSERTYEDVLMNWELSP